MPGQATQQTEITDAFEEHLEEARRQFLDLEIEHMKKGEVEARQEIEKARKAVEQKRSQLERALETARDAGTSAWSEAKEGLESAWGELQDAMEEVRSNFAEEGDTDG